MPNVRVSSLSAPTKLKYPLILFDPEGVGECRVLVDEFCISLDEWTKTRCALWNYRRDFRRRKVISADPPMPITSRCVFHGIVSAEFQTIVSAQSTRS